MENSMGALGFICAVILCGLIVAISNWWDGRKDSSGPKYIHSDDIHSEPELSTGTQMKMPHVDMETTKAIDLKSENNMEQTIGTRDLFLETLTKIGCQYTTDNDDSERYYFAYQGEHFAVDINNERLYVNLWDMFWESAELYDIDQLARLKKVINESNLRFATTTVYTVNEAGSTVDVHCKSVILFCQQIPDLENYLRTELNDFFHVHQYVNVEMAKLKEQEEATK